MESLVDSPPQFRAPNSPGSLPEPQRSEESMLIGELSSMPNFRVYLREIVAPRIVAIRKKLLADFGLSNEERYATLAVLAEHREVLEAVYSNTESGELPAELRTFFS
jgi:hypothetical protein